MHKADNLPSSCAVVTKSGKLNFLEHSGPLQVCNGTDLPLPLPLPQCSQANQATTDMFHVIRTSPQTHYDIKEQVTLKNLDFFCPKYFYALYKYCRLLAPHNAPQSNSNLHTARTLQRSTVEQ